MSQKNFGKYIRTASWRVAKSVFMKKLWKDTVFRNRLILSHEIHGQAVDGKWTRTYHSWQAMRGRCLCRTNVSWKSYGGRGIRICKRWNSFEKFLEDMGERPRGMTLHRVDNDGNYFPSNCRWATFKQQRLHQGHK